MNLNVEIFRKYKAERKAAIVFAASQQDLLRVNTDTITRIIKEVGEGSSAKARSHDKRLKLQHKVSNNWNSDIEEVALYHKKLWIGFYLQYDNTDTPTDDSLENFLQPGPYTGSYEYEDRYGHTQTTYFRYNLEQKAAFIKELLLTYINLKYN